MKSLALLLCLFLTACAHEPRRKPERTSTLTTEKLVIVNSRGEVRGEFGVDPRNGHVGLTIYDSRGTKRAILSLRDDRNGEVGLTLIDRKDKALAQIFIDDLGPVVELFDGKRVVHRAPN